MLSTVLFISNHRLYHVDGTHVPTRKKVLQPAFFNPYAF